jgi:hypothetical protein
LNQNVRQLLNALDRPLSETFVKKIYGISHVFQVSGTHKSVDVTRVYCKM